MTDNIRQDSSQISDYDAQIEDVLGDTFGSEDEEEFLYDGKDAEHISASYNEQLRTFVDPSEDDGYTLAQNNNGTMSYPDSLTNTEETVTHDPSPKTEALSLPSPSSSVQITSIDNSTSVGVTIAAPLSQGVSRLRSSHYHSPNQNGLFLFNTPEFSTPSSRISRTPSVLSVNDGKRMRYDREVFHWVTLKDIGQHLYPKKASSILGSFHGLPTVLSANGLICIGTTMGHVIVYDSKQQLKCVCEPTFASMGSVSAVALSRDHTYLAVGYSSGHINLFDLSRPQIPVRSVSATSLAAVSSGRKEGHLQGTRISSIDFVGARHTAIVSADEHGLAFYHSLGKVLFVEATDTLRILGKYPNTLPLLGSSADAPAIKEAVSPTSIPSKSTTILAMSSLPLGTASHSIEGYNLIALLTPSKLVVVGLEPSPRTWFRRHRQATHGASFDIPGVKGCMAWYPCVHSNHVAATAAEHLPWQYSPLLAYSWGRDIYVLRVYESKIRKEITNRNRRTSERSSIVEVGKVDYLEISRWSTNVECHAIQWINPDLLLGVTSTNLEVWSVSQVARVEVVPFDTLNFWSRYSAKLNQIAHCVRVYKGRIFLLGDHELRAGTLLSWADRVLSFVEKGDFLSAITTAQEYYTGTAPGNRMGLPDDNSAMRALVGQQIQDLMTASARFTFAEERLTDSTHVTPDGRGVDRTPLFEGLVDVCVEASLELNDFTFIFEDLFDYYQNAGIVAIFLKRLEPFILAGRIHSIPPRITQCLVAMHQQNGHLDEAERVIWHIDPDCLDIDQAIALCRENLLYDALIYVHTRSLHDFVTPLVELLGLIRGIQRQRRLSRLATKTIPPDLRSMAIEAYKIYTYLADVLSGLVYPSQIPMSSEEASRAKRDIYSFLFFGRSYVWPQGQNGQLVLTSEEDSVPEPTYPYVRLLLRFDSEAFLHALDIAFEDDYFNDDDETFSRIVIIRILLEMLSATDFLPTDLTMLNIFIARNIPKYPQSIHAYMAPSDLHGILIGLAKDLDKSTREDRQLAAEYLLSVYTPHDSDKVTTLFETAGFFRILRSWYRHDEKWGPLISTYLRDSDIDPAEIFECLNEVLLDATHNHKLCLSPETIKAFIDALPRLLQTELSETALLVDKHSSDLHQLILSQLLADDPHRQFVYLRCLVEPSALTEEHYWSHPTFHDYLSSDALDMDARELYVNLLCRYEVNHVVRCLSNSKEGYFSWRNIASICTQNGAFDAIIWCLNKMGEPDKALEQFKSICFDLTMNLQGHLGPSKTISNVLEIRQLIGKIKALADMGLQICTERANDRKIPESTMEDLWFTLLSSQIDVAQRISGFCVSHLEDDGALISEEQETLDILRSLVQKTFTSLMAFGLCPGLSFPRLFKRLVDSASKTRSSGYASYSEFRLILTGMLDSYKAEGDLLLITNHLVERDFFTVVKEYTRRRHQGARVRDPYCNLCKCILEGDGHGNLVDSAHDPDQSRSWIIRGTSGLSFHRRCLQDIENTM